MIVDKSQLPGDEVEIPGDAPPSYDALEGVPPAATAGDAKAGPSNQPLSSPSSSFASYPPSVGHGRGRGIKRGGSAWFNFGPSGRAAREVRTTVLGLLRDLVKHTDWNGAFGVLESCADACRSYDLSLSSLLQEPSVEGHTPIYWAIINRPSPPESDGPDLVSALLSHAAPLTDATVDEIRLACLHTSDHTLFQELRRSPAFSPLTGTEEILLGRSVPVDDVDVEDVTEDEGAFVAKFRIPLFQKRMRISGSIRLEFIAKGRLWELSFIVAAKEYDKRFGHRHFKAGSWVIRLGLLPHSPPTCIDSRLVIEDPRSRGQDAQQQPATPSSYAGLPTSLSEAVMAGDDDPATPASPSSSTPRPRPRVELRLETREQLVAPRQWEQGSQIVMALEESALANSLQYNGCPYLEPDGSLIARLEAKLGPPGSDCVIC
ncbi:hypothetical protein BD309DRAFT_965754 [Dichomitus squalens]|uniref:Uncharacterized protein n=1 Tax=Dichomitus squalens TaxID=114155 RepID=A0A4Q9PPR5_9APHY|nr:hypothetical protein BD309DRAFT_965754 [Dichomitus squalens]TBU56317.1 hypothetical protein BD310DRAFT_931658 [Dichomitus squalens]